MSTMLPMLFVNLPIADVARSRAFFEALGFGFNDAFCDETALCMRVNEGAYYMLLTHEKFGSFTDREVVLADRGDAAMHALSVPSREAVDEGLAKALAIGGVDTGRTEEHGFMYGRSFLDPDGHRWELFWMDPAAIPPAEQ